MSLEFLNTDVTVDTLHNAGVNNEKFFWADKRQYKRETVYWSATCHAHGLNWKVNIVDASNGGFGVNARLPLDVGTELRIVIDQIGTFECKIAWLGRDRCGLELLESKDDLTHSQVQFLCSVLSHAEENPDSKSLSDGQLNELGALLKV